jgi:hypothetical protein
VTARFEISRSAPTRAGPFRSTIGWFPRRLVPNGGAEKIAHSWNGAAMERWTEPEPRKLDRDSGVAEPLPARPKAHRRKPLARLAANAAQKTKGKFSCLQTLEISQNRKIISRRAVTEPPPPETRDDGLAANPFPALAGERSAIERRRPPSPDRLWRRMRAAVTPTALTLEGTRGHKPSGAAHQILYKPPIRALARTHRPTWTTSRFGRHKRRARLAATSRTYRCRSPPSARPRSLKTMH